MQDTNYTCGIVNKGLGWRDYQIAQQTTGGQKLGWSVTAVLSLGCSASAFKFKHSSFSLSNSNRTKSKLRPGEICVLW